MGRAFVPDRRDWLRLLGGVLFAVGAVVLVARKGGEWSNFATLLTLLVPTVVLLGAGFAAPRDAPLAWRSTYLVAGVVLLPALLLQFVNWIGGDPGADLNLVWIFAVSAAVAAYAAVSRGAVYTLLLAALALIVSWVSLWDKIIGSPSADTFRWILSRSARSTSCSRSGAGATRGTSISSPPPAWRS